MICLSLGQVELSKNSSQCESLNGSKIQIKGTTPQDPEEERSVYFHRGPWLRSNVLTVEDGDPRSPLSLPLVSLQFLEPVRIGHRLRQIPHFIEQADSDFPQGLSHGLGIQSDEFVSVG